MQPGTHRSDARHWRWSHARRSGSCPGITHETGRRTWRICVAACRRVQEAQWMRFRASGAGGRFAAYKAEDGGSSPSVPTSTDNILRGCDASGEGWADLQVRQKSVRGSNAPSVRRLGVATPCNDTCRRVRTPRFLPCRAMVTAGPSSRTLKPCMCLVVAGIESWSGLKSCCARLRCELTHGSVGGW
jgi:hypothetical protein